LDFFFRGCLKIIKGRYTKAENHPGPFSTPGVEIDSERNLNRKINLPPYGKDT